MKTFLAFKQQRKQPFFGHARPRETQLPPRRDDPHFDRDILRVLAKATFRG